MTKSDDNIITKSNHHVDSFILHGEFHIEENWAMQQLADYFHELQLLERGASYTDLGIAARRHAQAPNVIHFLGGSPKVLNNPDVLQNEAETPQGSFALLKLQGVMRSEGGLCSRGMAGLVEDFQAAYQNDHIEGILLEANTGGGEVTAGQMLQGIIAGSPKPVLVYAHFLASAGVMATLPVDEIIASGEQARVGSIGTFVTVSKWMQSFYNENYEDIYAEKSNNKNADFRAYLRGDFGPLRESVNRTNDIFLSEVQNHRPLKGNIEDTLSGKVFHAREAKRRGLIDGIGNFNHAVERLQANVKRRKKAM